MSARRSFTLIEMLVVTAIIAVLAAMLTPSLQKALRTTRSVACANNLRQIGVWALSYTDDWNGILPTHNDGNELGTYSLCRGWINAMREAGMDADLRHGTGFVCSELYNLHAADFNRNSASGLYTGYSLNTRLGGKLIKNKTNQTITPNVRLLSSRKFWFSDGHAYSTDRKFDVHASVMIQNYDANGTDAYGPWAWVRENETENGVQFNPLGGHSGRMDANFLYGDGRVAPLGFPEFFSWEDARRQEFQGIDRNVK